MDISFVDKHAGGTGASADICANVGQDGLRLPSFTADVTYSIIEIRSDIYVSMQIQYACRRK